MWYSLGDPIYRSKILSVNVYFPPLIPLHCTCLPDLVPCFCSSPPASLLTLLSSHFSSRAPQGFVIAGINHDCVITPSPFPGNNRIILCTFNLRWSPALAQALCLQSTYYPSYGRLSTAALIRSRPSIKMLRGQAILMRWNPSPSGPKI